MSVSRLCTVIALGSTLLCCVPKLKGEFEIPRGALGNFQTCMETRDACGGSPAADAWWHTRPTLAGVTVAPPELREWRAGQVAAMDSADRKSISITYRGKEVGVLHRSDVTLAELREQVLESPFQTQLVQVIKKVEDKTTDEVEVRIRYKDFRSYRRDLQELQLRKGFAGSMTTDIELYLDSQALDARSRTVAQDYKDTVDLIERYWRDYFRGGGFFALTASPGSGLDTQAGDLKKTLKEKYPYLPESEIDKFVDRLKKQIADGIAKFSYGKIADTGFVTRAGVSYQCPAIKAEIDVIDGTFEETLTNVDTTALVSDLIRITIEAIGDAELGVPGVKASSGVGVGSPIGLTEYDPTDGVTAEEFNRINEYANKAEDLLSSTTGGLVRGLSWASLNNEVLATAIETAVGVAARKGVEKVGWCVFCVTGSDREARLVETASPLTVRVVVK